MILTKAEAIKKLESYKDGDIVDLKKVRKKTIRTNAQNRYYRGVIIEMIADYIWLEHSFEKEELHASIKQHFGIETTTGLSKKEFADMCNEIRKRYIEYREFYIPLPNEVQDLESLQDYLF